MQTVIQTRTFLADAKTAGVTEDEMFDLVSVIAADAGAGDIIPGTGGARKVRIGGKGKGKSGGYRVITYFAVVDVPVFLLRLVSKGQRADIGQADRNALQSFLSTLVDEYRKSTRLRASSPPSHLA